MTITSTYYGDERTSGRAGERTSGRADGGEPPFSGHAFRARTRARTRNFPRARTRARTHNFPRARAFPSRCTFQKEPNGENGEGRRGDGDGDGGDGVRWKTPPGRADGPDGLL